MTYLLFAIATAVTVPLYLFILLAILWRPKLTPFHTLMLSQVSKEDFISAFLLESKVSFGKRTRDDCDVDRIWLETVTRKLNGIN